MENIETPVKLDAKERRKLYMKEYLKQYQKNRMNNDPDFAEKHREAVRVNMRNKRKNDPEYQEKKRIQDRERYHKYKEAFIILKSQNAGE